MARRKAADGNDESGKTRFSPFLRVLLPSAVGGRRPTNEPQ